MNKRVLKNIIILPLLLLFAVAIFFTSGTESVKADGEFTYTDVFGFSEAEFTALNAPQRVCRGKKYTAVNENNSKISIFINESGKKIAEFSSAKTLGEIRAYGEEDFLIIQEGSIYRLYFDGDILKDDYLLDDENKPFGLNFDYNGEHLVVSHENKVKIYTLNGINATATGEQLFSAYNSPVAVNDKGEFFYLNDSNDLKMYTLDGNVRTVAENISFSEKSVDLLAAADKVYYIGKDNSIYSVTVNAEGTSVPVKLSVDDAVYPDYDKYDLGKLVSPTGICFNGKNILVSDSDIGAVQEFKILEEDKLAFTGYAIADGKTAFNRISSLVKTIDKYNGTVAVLDEFKLTVFCDNESFDRYDYGTFINLFVSDAPDNFALGNGKILLVRGDKLYTVNTDGSFYTELDGTYNVKDLTYQSGEFYVLTADSVYKISDTSTPARENDGKTVISTDVFGSVSLFSYDIITRVRTDLIGNIYGIKGNTFYRFDKDAGTFAPEKALEKNISSFAMGFEDRYVYFALEDGRTVYRTNSLSNVAISSITVPAGFNDKSSAVPLLSLNVVSAKEGANLYYTDNSGETFNFISLLEGEEEYVLISKITLNDNEFYALSGTNGVVLINSKDAVSIPVTISSSPVKLYVTTSVHIYAVPVLNIKEDNKLARGENDFFLERGDVLFTDGNAKFTFAGKEFYYCTFATDNGEVSGYVPVLFTTEILNEEETVKNYSLRTLSPATVYADAELSTELIKTESDETVRVYENANGIIKIALKTENGWVTGYVSENKIKNAPNAAIRNVLIIVATVAVLAGTASYFILRKKG